MKPDKLTVHDLFQKERRYVVPLYQRSYVWTREDQWEPLWEDIERQAEECLAAENNVARRSHFLGAIVLNVAKIVGSSVARSEIIDGQQRLTTLQLFLAALRDYAAGIGSEHASRLAKLTINEYEKPGSEASFKVWPTNADRDLFRTVMTAKSRAALLTSLNVEHDTLPRIAAAYVYFSEVIQDFVDQSGVGGLEQKDHRIFGLMQALRTALQFVLIELEENDDPQVIFETLNARGQPLLPSDLIRNFIFLQIANDPKLSADDLYVKFWKPFDDLRVEEAVKGEDRFWHIEERQGRLTRPRIDLFMFHYLTMKTERDLNIGQLFREFRDWRDDDPRSLETFLADLRAHSKVFAEIIEPTGHDRAAIFARRLKALDISTVYPLLLFLLSVPREHLSVTSRDQILDDLESWLVRRLVCQLTTKNYNRFFVALLAKMKNAENVTSLPSLVRAELMRSTEPTTNWPDEVEFRRGWLSKPIYQKSRSDRSAMVLRALEEGKRTSKNEAISLPSTLTVEHYLPQKGTLADYPYAQHMPVEVDESADRCRARLIHTIGNLTLLTQELNSAVGNGPFRAKSQAIAADSDLRLNAWLRGGAVDGWSEDNILLRGEELLKIASTVWQFPNDFVRLTNPKPSVKTAAEAIDDADLTETKFMQRDYWEAFNSVLNSKGGPVSGNKKPQPQSWMAYPIGKAAVHLGAAMSRFRNHVRAELYMSGANAKAYFGLLKRQKEAIEQELGYPLEWEELPAGQDSRISACLVDASLKNNDDWKRQHEWLAEKLNDMHRVFSRRVKELSADDWQPEDNR